MAANAEIQIKTTVIDRAESNEEKKKVISPRSVQEARCRRGADGLPACVLLSTHAAVEAPADTRHVGAHESAASEKHPLASGKN
jgi:hypothetical protein